MTEWIVTSSVLILAVLVLRFALRGRISLRLQYALWALVLLRLLIPVSFFSSPVSVMLAAERLAGRHAADFHDYVSGVQLPSGSVSSPGMTAEQAQKYGEEHGWGTLYQAATPQAPDQPSTYYFTRGTLGDALEKWAARLWYAGIAAAGLCFIAANANFGRKLRKMRKALRADGCPLPVFTVESLPSPCLFGFFPSSHLRHPGRRRR